MMKMIIIRLQIKMWLCKTTHLPFSDMEQEELVVKDANEQDNK